MVPLLCHRAVRSSIPQTFDGEGFPKRVPTSLGVTSLNLKLVNFTSCAMLGFNVAFNFGPIAV